MNVQQTMEIDAVFRQLRREVWIVTAAYGERRGGLAATWVSPASIDETAPVVMIAIASNHFTAELIDGRRAFGLHLLRPKQIDLVLNFALGSGRNRDKLAGIATTAVESSVPILCDCLAWLDCRVAARLDAGDRIYYWADVVSGGRNGIGIPLTDQELFAAVDDEQRKMLLESRSLDAEVQRPLAEKWREELPELLRPPGNDLGPRLQAS